MNLDELRQRIESITACTIIEQRMTEEDWEHRNKDQAVIPVMQNNNEWIIWQPVFSESTQTPDREDSSPRNHQQVYQLLKLLLPSVSGWQPITVHSGSEIEQQTRELGQWIVRQLSSRNPLEDLPQEYTMQLDLNSKTIPFLLITESLQAGLLNPRQLEKLLESYFEKNVILIPLQDDEWVILASYELIADAEQNEIRGSHRDKNRDMKEQSKDPGRDNSKDILGEAEDTEEDLLTAFALGLHELIASEWVGSFHIGVAQPIYPKQELVKSVGQLRETIHLGQLFHVTEHIHLPWELRLESLLYRIPEEERLRFVESADHHSHLFNDEETVATLETFFKMDCNVSETAKQLYIHRNTLLYRLDKIKQDTQLDVRKFEDAVLMRLTLLLYKVTKS